MIKKSVLKEIDRTIKTIWKKDIQKDYREEYLLREDSLKCAMYYHLRKKLDKLLRENHLRIYPEYYFKELRYRADLAVVEIDEETEYSWIGEAVKDVVALFELKCTSGGDDATINWIKNDIWKFKDYLNVARLTDCQFYFTAIYENECEWLNWLDARSTNNWAKGRVTELNSGRINGEVLFEVHSYNGMNTELNDSIYNLQL